MLADPTFSHISALTDRFGTFEHARHTTPRREHGYCTDDVARLLVVASRAPRPTPTTRALARASLRFVADAQGVDGRARNRRTSEGRWHGRRTVDDCWGRSLWGLGSAAAHGGWTVAADALERFDRGAEQRSRWPRSMAFAALGAAAVLTAHPQHRRATALLEDAVEVIGRPAWDTPDWPWPEPRLTYANAALADALVAAGAALHREDLVDDGLGMLRWLLERETLDGHLSVTPVDGSGPHDERPGFDQQPIEVATLAEACARAAALTGDGPWYEGVHLANRWFDGENDAGALMWDPVSGGGFDGLQADGPNRNQGAESTLALIATRQCAERIGAPTSALG
jgi:hypothetical protein